MLQVLAHVDSAGRVVIPAPFRKQLGLNPGDEVTIALEQGSLRVMPVAEAIRQAQALVRKHIPGERSLSRELSKERRRDAARE